MEKIKFLVLLEGVKQCIFIEEIGKIKTIRDWRDEGKEEKFCP